MKYLLRTKHLYSWYNAHLDERYPIDLYFLFTGDDIKLHDIAFMHLVIALGMWIHYPGSNKLVLSGYVESAKWDIFPIYLTHADREALTKLKFTGVAVVTYDEFSCTGKVLVELSDEPAWVKEMLEGFTVE